MTHMTLYPVFGIISVLCIAGYFWDMFLLRSDRFLAALLIINAPAFVAVKWSNYNNSWRWRGLLRAPQAFIAAWRWTPRLLLMFVVGAGVFAAIFPEKMRNLGLGQERFLRVSIESVLIMLNVWFCGFVIVGDQTLASWSTRQKIYNAKRWLLGRRSSRASGRDSELD